MPGVTFRQWDQVDARGPIRAYLLTLDPATPGLAIDYAAEVGAQPRDRARMIARDHAIAGINGDFYDISTPARRSGSASTSSAGSCTPASTGGTAPSTSSAASRGSPTSR